MSLCDKCVCAPVCANRDVADPEIMQHCVFFSPPRPTCKNNVQAGGGLLCSRCGAFTPHVRDLCGEIPIRACGSCGAKVVDE